MPILLLGLFVAACGPAPHGEVLVVVDTDLPVPQIVGRLRIDAYTSRGYWFDSRDVARPDPRDWPASFSVYSPDEEDDTVLVRMRAYPDGRTRTYRGERSSDRVFSEPFVPRSAEEMCANAPKLELGGTLVIRRGRTPLYEALFGDECTAFAMTAGSAAAYFDVPESGRYRVAVLASTPEPSQVTLQLRSDCANELSGIRCLTGAESGEAVYPDFGIDLDPGRYWLVVGSSDKFNGPADITLAAARDDAFDPIIAHSEPAEDEAVRLFLRNDPELTPGEEPEPSASVDRLLLLRLKHGEVGTAHVTLSGACAGIAAMLGADGLPSPDSAQTCVDGDGSRVPIHDATLEPGLIRPIAGDTSQGSFVPNEICPAHDSGASVVCVPGGVFLLGDRLLSGATPERIARVPRFWIDRYEVTVARWRTAVGQGFDPALPFPHPHEPDRDAPRSHTNYPECNWTAEPGPFEALAVSCVSWYGARAFCRFYGGDLPTEAQWEYVASAAGRQFETVYPWGDEAPSCTCQPDAVGCRAPFFGIAPWLATASEPGECDTGAWQAFEPSTVPPPEAQGGPTGDVSVQLGVVGLAGGLEEWVRDSFHPYDEGCWLNAHATDARCWENEALERTLRGGGLLRTRLALRAAGRHTMIPTLSTMGWGFRCAYDAPPP